MWLLSVITAFTMTKHMYTLIRLLVGALYFGSGTACTTVEQVSSSKPISHALWSQLLQKHVSDNGRVDYEGIKKDAEKFNAYTELLSNNHPNEANWSENERMAYWINAYNAFTVQLVVEHIPVESIKDIKRGLPFINSVWDIKFIEIEGMSYDLNKIEHGILRKEFEDPRIHFAINCASISCPSLRNEAYTGDKLEEQLKEQTERFLSDASKNVIEKEALQLSKIFKWFGSDFRRDGTLIDFLNQYSTTQIAPDAHISFLDYDWNIND